MIVRFSKKTQKYYDNIPKTYQDNSSEALDIEDAEKEYKKGEYIEYQILLLLN